MRLRQISILVLVFLGVGTVRPGRLVAEQAAAARAGQNATPRLEHTTFTLTNGLKVILSQDKRLPMVAVNLWYHVGPANEVPGRTGFAHLLDRKSVV